MKIEGIPSIAASLYSFGTHRNPFLRDTHQAIAREVSARFPSGRLLDIGTGAGNVPIAIAQINPNLQIMGIDISPGMVKVSSKNAATVGVGNQVQFEVASAGELPFENESYDFAISTMSLHHWSEPSVYIKEIRRVLKPGGEFHIYDFWNDATDEAKSSVKERYSPFLSPLFLRIVKMHSIKMKDAHNILESVDTLFTRKSVENSGVLLRLEMLK